MTIYDRLWLKIILDSSKGCPKINARFELNIK